jgi:hypothetical protein
MADFLILLLIALQGADYYTTREAIEHGGREKNTRLLVYRDWLARIGVPGKWTWLWSSKLVIAVGLAVAWAFDGFASPLALLVLTLVTAFYVWVVVNNTRVLRILKP